MFFSSASSCCVLIACANVLLTKSLFTPVCMEKQFKIHLDKILFEIKIIANNIDSLVTCCHVSLYTYGDIIVRTAILSYHNDYVILL